MKLVRFGSGLHVSKSSGNLIVRAEENVRIGEHVYIKQGKKVGRVFDFFGPVTSPYASIRTDTDAKKLVGKSLFISPKKQK